MRKSRHCIGLKMINKTDSDFLNNLFEELLFCKDPSKIEVSMRQKMEDDISIDARVKLFCLIALINHRS